MHALSSVIASPRFQSLVLLAFLCSYPLSLVLQPAWAWENAAVETAQVVVLGAGGLLASYAWLRTRPGAGAMLALCALPAWMILVGRELSWGAVFLPPLGFGPEGPIYSSSILWYRPMVVPVAAALLALAGYHAWRHRVDRVLRGAAAGGHFPWGLLAVMAVAGLASSLVEGHLAVPRDMFMHGELLEELVELVGYVALLAAQERLFQAGALGCTARRASPSPCRAAP